ncbi:WD40/YVTN/BNR-like repeat-containing protein [Pararhodobacter zhoushanensis]|uniref:Exo-alpha-sialidase n=1 Tax=Pararhodobacter zhoushanensis TaxID=2479545 RepID=A0ABT3GTV8_9RHOB|nr:sialidase family protein [Pararhodobacter zhoushanensis]MCW1930971.1 exo-alpha-sialidase [Pararhodobacter zhoushanensis]
MGGQVTVLAATSKGLFLVDSDEARKDWTLSGPFCDGWPVAHALGDPQTGTIWAAAGGEWQGSAVFRSHDHGASWTHAMLANGHMDVMLAQNEDFRKMLGRGPGPDAPFKGEITALWALGRVGDTLYAGAKPAALYASHDNGDSWQRVQGLSDHPSADSWEPGGAGLVLHTILGEGEKLLVGISSAGVFASEDGGATWERRNRRTNLSATPHPVTGQCESDIGLCVHNITRSADGQTLYMQNHTGVFRSRDEGRSWDEISDGLPSKFGFPVAAHPSDPDTLYVLPLSEWGGRTPPEGKATIWRSRNAGDNWEPMREGLPDNAYFTVLRQAMATDKADKAGIYFGTNSGSVFASTDDGDSWSEIARHLPTVLGVEVMHRR